MAVRVDHNYPDTDDLKVVDLSGNPIDGVIIRIFEYAAFVAGETDTWVGGTSSDINGHWIDPVYLDEAQTWVVHFEKPTAFGPEHVEITT
jgi:hypothetical protein